MNPGRRRLAAVLSGIISNLRSLILPLLHESSSDDTTDNLEHSKTLHVINNFLAESNAAAASHSSVVTRKRKRSSQIDADFGNYDPSRIRVGCNPDSFKLCFKMRSSTFEWLSGMLEPLLDFRDPVGSPLNLSLELRLGIGLFRLATGSGYAEIGRRFGVSEFTVRFCTKQLCRVLCANYRFWVGFPAENEVEKVCSCFEGVTGLPNCCGVLVCLRFQRSKSLRSIAAQIVVDPELRILSIAAGFDGDKSDFEVLKGSTLYKDVQDGSLLSAKMVDIGVDGVGVRKYLVGGNEYPLLPWLMVPFAKNWGGSSEEKFNNAVGLMMRSPGMRTVASLRSWGVLREVIEGDYKTAVKYIGACSILHNVLLMRDDDSALGDNLEYDQTVDYYCGGRMEATAMDSEEGLRMRNALAAIF